MISLAATKIFQLAMREKQLFIGQLRPIQSRMLPAKRSRASDQMMQTMGGDHPATKKGMIDIDRSSLEQTA